MVYCMLPTWSLVSSGLDLFLDSNIPKCSKQAEWHTLRGTPYCVKPELDDGSVIEFTDLCPNGDVPLLFVLIFLIPLPGAVICIRVLGNRAQHTGRTLLSGHFGKELQTFPQRLSFPNSWWEKSPQFWKWEQIATWTLKDITDHGLLFFFFAVFIFLGCLIRQVIICAKFQKQDGGGKKNPHYNLWMVRKKMDF